MQTAAGVISLLNDYLLSENKPPLGFLNPWLYGRGLAGLRDVTSGRNQGCGTKGFAAIEGWDAVRVPRECLLILSTFVLIFFFRVFHRSRG